MASQLGSSPFLNQQPSPSPSLHSSAPTSSSSSSSHRHHSHSHNNNYTHQSTPDTAPSSSSSSSSRRHHSSHRSSSSSSSSSSRPRSSSVNNERSSRRHSSKHSHNHHQNNTNGHGHPTYHAHHPRPSGLLPAVSSSAKTTPMHDDTDAGRLIPVNQPALAIDYLGSGWNNEDDIAASWKFMTKQKNDLINGLRLENASWRNWAKQRHNLKTISPKSLNWLKDSDTTWLYGPLYKAAIDEFDRSRFGAQTVASTAAGGSISIPTTPTRDILDPLLPADLVAAVFSSSATTTSSAPTTPPASSTSTFGAGVRKSGGPLKPVLKHKTASELFKADTLFHVQSDMRLNRKIEPLNKANQSAVFKQHRQPKLRFNDSVEQCVSIDTDVISEEDEESLALDNDIQNNSSSRSNNNRKDDEDAQVGLNRRHEDEDGGLLIRISNRRPPRSIVRIDSTTLKAANLHGIRDEDLEDPEDASTTEEEDEEGLFDEPIYLGNPYTGSGTTYVGSRQGTPHEAALDDVSYTRPSPPSPSAVSTASNESSASSSVFYPATSTSVSSNIDAEEQLLQQQQPQQQEQQQQPVQQPQQQQQNTTFVVTQTSPRTISSSFMDYQQIPSSNGITTITTPLPPAPSAARTALASALEAEKTMAANGGMQQRATDLVANVKGLVNWASSFVFNSSTF